jgi:hypothetical protein
MCRVELDRQPPGGTMVHGLVSILEQLWVSQQWNQFSDVVLFFANRTVPPKLRLGTLQAQTLSVDSNCTKRSCWQLARHT